MRYPGNELFVSAREAGSIFRFANHAPGAAANIDVLPLLVDGAYHMVLVTRREIARGAALHLDYGVDFWAARHCEPSAVPAIERA